MIAIPRSRMASSVLLNQASDDDENPIHQVKVWFFVKLSEAADPNRSLLEQVVRGLTSVCTAECRSPSAFISNGWGYMNAIRGSGLFQIATQERSQTQPVDADWVGEAEFCHYNRTDTWQHFYVSWMCVDYSNIGRAVRVKAIIRPRWTDAIVFEFWSQRVRRAFDALVKVQRQRTDTLQQLKSSIESEVSSSSEVKTRNLILGLNALVGQLDPGQSTRAKVQCKIEPATQCPQSDTRATRPRHYAGGTSFPLVDGHPRPKQEQMETNIGGHQSRTDIPLARATASVTKRAHAGPSMSDPWPQIPNDDGSDEDYVPLAQLRAARILRNTLAKTSTPVAPRKNPKVIETSIKHDDSDDEPLALQRPLKSSRANVTPQRCYPTPPVTPASSQAVRSTPRPFHPLGTFNSPEIPKTPSRSRISFDLSAAASPSPERILPLLLRNAPILPLPLSKSSSATTSRAGTKRPAPNNEKDTNSAPTAKRPRLETSTQTSSRPTYIPYMPRHLPTDTEKREYLRFLCNEVLADPRVWETLRVGTRQELMKAYPAFARFYDS